MVRTACHISWILFFFPQMSRSWLLPNFLKAKRWWETAERKRSRYSFCGLRGFDHSSNVFTRWNNLLQEIAERLRASKGLLQLWQRYKDCYEQCSSTVHQREAQTNELLKTATSKDIADDEVTTWIQDCNVCSVKLCTFSQHCGLKITTGSPFLNCIHGVLETCVQTQFFLLTHVSGSVETDLLIKSHAFLRLFMWSLHDLFWSCFRSLYLKSALWRR